MNRIAVLLGLMLVCTFGCGGGQNSTNAESPDPEGTPPSYSLTLSVENGTATITPDLMRYTAGTSVTIEVTPDDGYDFYDWSGEPSGMPNPLVVTMNSDSTITAVCVLTYYVDFDNGSDDNDGRSAAAAWKHAPGDARAEANPAAVDLEPGTRILFRGSVVYRGRIDIPADGSETQPIIYQGNAWPGEENLIAVIDGGDLITDWTPCESAQACGGNPDYAELYYTFLPASVDPLSINLHEYNAAGGDDEFLWPAQDPDPSDPYFYDNRYEYRVVPQINLTRTSLADPDYFNQSDPDYWDDSYILVWINPNLVATRAITGFDPVTHTVRAAEKMNYPNLLVSWPVFSVTASDEYLDMHRLPRLEYGPTSGAIWDNLFFPRP